SPENYSSLASAEETQADEEEADDLKPRRPFWRRLLYYNPCSYYLPRRYGVATLAFLGFCNVYALRVNLSVAIVAMSSDEFDWDSKMQGWILSSFFYGYIVTQIPGGWLANRFGGKKVFGYGMLTTSILAIVTPVLTRLGGAPVLVAIRVAQGLAEGVVFPAMHGVWSHWSPVHERSRLATIAFSGSYVGTVFSLVISGFLAEHVGYQSIFYFFGVFAFLWTILWLTNVGETPAEDKRISEEELNYIVTSIGTQDVVGYLNRVVEVLSLENFAENWGFYTLLTFLPRFMKDMFDMQLSQAGLISALPYMFMALVVQFAGFLADYFRATYMSTTLVRKLFTCGAFLSQTIFMLGAAYVSTPGWAIACITLSVGLGGFAWAGFSVNHLDIGPRYAGILMGISNTFATIPGMVSPTLAGKMLQNGTIDEWREVFSVSSTIYVIGAVGYGLLASGETQRWAESISTVDLTGATDSD
ncbi:Sialin, partial [Orchesella cincta]